MAFKWTPKLAASRSKRRIASIHKMLELIAGDYGDVDNTIVYKCDEIIGHLEELTEYVQDALNEKRGA